MTKISVIMPVYNSEQYLSQAVDSVLSQDFEDFELILVDDGSTDGSGRLCDAYAEKDAKVRVIHKKNGGICSARNAGLAAARGEYLAFCDNDDRYRPHLMRDNYKLAKENQADLLRFSRIKIITDEKGRTRTTVTGNYEGRVEKKDFGKYFLELRGHDAVWTGLYRRSIVEENHLRFDENVRYGDEDTYFNLDFLPYCEIIYFHNQVYYEWIQRYSHSTSASFHEEHLKTFTGRLEKDERFAVQCCDNQVSKADKARYGNMVVYGLLEYLNRAGGEFSSRRKALWFQRVRNTSFFSMELSKRELREIFRGDRKAHLVFSSFYLRRWRLLLLIGRGIQLLNEMRMR